MRKADLLNIKLPAPYQDCSNWFEEGLDNIPSLLDFLHLQKSRIEYEKFQQLYAIENMKKYLKVAKSEDDLKEANAVIEEAIQKYNMM